MPAGQIVLSRPSAKIDIGRSGALETIPAGQLGWNGRIEPASTQVIEPDFQNAAWMNYLGGQKGGTVQGPDGGAATGTIVTFDGSHAYDAVYQDYIGTAGVWTVSVWAKGVTGQKFRLSIYDGTTTFYSDDFSVTPTWTRYSYTKDTGILSVANISIRAQSDGSVSTINVAYGNLCKESYATTTIVSAATTRAADSLYWSGDFSASRTFLCIGTLANVVYGNRLGSLVNDENQRRSDLYLIQNNYFQDYATGPGGADVSGFTVSPGDTLAMGSRWSDNEHTLCVNGVFSEPSIGACPIIPTKVYCNELPVGGYGGNAVHLIMLFNRVLTDAEMQLLTSASFRNAVSQ